MYLVQTLERFAEVLPEDQRFAFRATISGLATVTRNGLDVVLRQEMIRAGLADIAEKLENEKRWLFFTPVSQLGELSAAREEHPND